MRVRFGDCVFDSERHELLRGGRPAELAPKAFALLEALIEARPAAISKEALYERLWPGVFVETGNLHTLVADIRSAIGDDAHQIIRTVHRVGYAFAAEVSSDDEADAMFVIGSRQLPLHNGENIVGRESIGSPDVSRRHARVTLADGSATVEDLDSKNGTWINGARIESTSTLHDGEEVVFGRTRAVFRIVRNDRTMTVPPPASGSRE